VRLRHEAAKFRRKAFLARWWPTERRLRKLMLITMQATVPRAAFERVNGFDETFRGWGEEDLDLGLRLQLAGLRPRGVIAASRVLHLHHEPAARGETNRDYYRRPRKGQFRCERGLVQVPQNFVRPR
jgi:GT2 family glycosyltransferase